MELGLSLGDAAAATAPKPFGFMEKAAGAVISSRGGSSSLSFCMGLSVTPSPSRDHNHHQPAEKKDGDKGSNGIDDKDDYKFTSSSRSNTATPTAKTQPKTAAASLLMMRDSTDHHHRDRKRPDSDSSMDPSVPLLQLDLLPNTPVVLRNHHANLLWPSDDGRAGETAGSSGCMARGFDVNRFPGAEEAEDGAPAVSSSPPNSAASSFQMDFCMYSGNKCQGNEGEGHERASSRASDDDENGSTRKKLRLSKEQSAFLEESFKEHHTLNPKQKLALAKQLNLRPRQVEVWFQNRRARTKLKQTEVDCEYLKRCCETLTEENRRLHKELQELRALKTSNPFYMQLPATTLTMCPSCERVATTTSTTATPTAIATATATTNSNNNNDNNNSSSSTDPTTAKGAAAAGGAAAGLSLATSRPRFYPFSQSSQPHHHSHQSKAC